MEQLVTPHQQELFKWAAMKIKPTRCRSLPIIKGNCREIKLSIDGNEIPTIHDKSVKRLSLCYSLPLTDRYHWQDLRKLLKYGLRSIDECNLNKDKVQCIYIGLFPKLSWPMQRYEERLISKYSKNGWDYLTPKQMWHYTVHQRS